VNDWSTIVLLVAVLVPSVILHEVSHGVVALWFGDDTAKRAGRITLNPIPHIDPFGTIILPLLLSLSSFGVFGYAKPVPVNTFRLRKPRQQALWVSLAGPAVNIVLAVGAALVFRAIEPPFWFGLDDLRQRDIAAYLVLTLGFLNVILAAFNLIPIPPLDGSAIIERFLPSSVWPQWLKLRQYSMGFLLILVLLVPGALGRVFDPAIRLWERLLT
jgi:Zn-dependent protease